MALVKRLVQRVNEWSRWRLPVEAEGIFWGVVREIELAVQVDVLRAHGRAGGDGISYGLALGRRGLE